MTWEHGPSNPDPDAYREPEPDAPPDDGKREQEVIDYLGIACVECGCPEDSTLHQDRHSHTTPENDEDSECPGPKLCHKYHPPHPAPRKPEAQVPAFGQRFSVTLPPGRNVVWVCGYCGTAYWNTTEWENCQHPKPEAQTDIVLHRRARIKGVQEAGFWDECPYQTRWKKANCPSDEHAVATIRRTR